MPLLPVEEEGRLNDARLRENFLERVYAYRRLRDLFGGAWRLRDLGESYVVAQTYLCPHPKELRLRSYV